MALLAACAASSCNGNKVYDKYAHTPIAGWEKNDTLSFGVPRMKTSGTYRSELGLRINNSYPFTGLTLIVEQHVYPANILTKDTLKCTLTDKMGHHNGKGVNYYQYKFGISRISLNRGDSLHVNVRHDMKREILPGISDVGISLSMH